MIKATPARTDDSISNSGEKSKEKEMSGERDLKK